MIICRPSRNFCDDWHRANSQTLRLLTRGSDSNTLVGGSAKGCLFLFARTGACIWRPRGDLSYAVAVITFHLKRQFSYSPFSISLVDGLCVTISLVQYMLWRLRLGIWVLQLNQLAYLIIEESNLGSRRRWCPSSPGTRRSQSARIFQAEKFGCSHKCE